MLLHTSLSIFLNPYPGTAVVLNRADVGTYGTMFKTVPETTKSYTNKMVCFKIPGVNGGSVTAQGILPDLTLYNVSKDVVSLHVSHGLQKSINFF